MIVIEDVFLALYLALLAPVLGDADGVGEALVDMGLAFTVLIGLAAVARWGARWVGKLVDAPGDELLLVCFIGLALLTAGLAEELGVEFAIAALMVGIMLGATSSRERITRFVHPCAMPSAPSSSSPSGSRSTRATSSR